MLSPHQILTLTPQLKQGAYPRGDEDGNISFHVEEEKIYRLPTYLIDQQTTFSHILLYHLMLIFSSVLPKQPFPLLARHWWERCDSKKKY